MVTTKEVGLNPNAKVWQEIPAPHHSASESPDDAPWLQTSLLPGEMTEGYSEVPFSEDKGYSTEYSDSSEGVTPIPLEGIHGGVDHPFPVFEPLTGPAAEVEVSKELVLSEGALRESLKKQLEFCFSRENLSKDLYLMSQMDGDQFVPVWAIACMEDVKVLTADTDLILDVLRASPMVEVDEAGEKVRPNHKRCIIILREVPETTPVEEVEALFQSENCPKVISIEFAHNSNWYITFQSDTDAQQAYRYLREEVKMFQGKPIMARIKAINTFFASNTFRSVDSRAYNQHSPPQQQYGTPLYMQQMYSPQQQYPMYPLVPPSWNSPLAPYFETPLAPFPNSGFVNGFNSPGSYKAGSNTMSAGRPMNKSQTHVKSHPRPGDPPAASSLLTAALKDGLSGLSGPQLPPGAAAGSPEPLMASALTFTQAATPIVDLGMTGQGRRGSSRGMRRRREDDHTRPAPLAEVKVPPPKFDLASSSFPPLPGCVVSAQEECVPETRLSDVVRGLRGTDKSEVKEVHGEPRPTRIPEDGVSALSPLAAAPVRAPLRPLQVLPPAPSVSPQVRKGEEKAEATVPKMAVASAAQAASLPAPQPASEPASAADTVRSPSGVNATATPPGPASSLESRKLSYAEVCQRPAKDPPPAQTPSPNQPCPAASQPLRELRVNKVEEPLSPSNHNIDRAEKPGDAGCPREPLGAYRGRNGPARAGGAGLKAREHQRGPPPGRRFAPQGGPRRSGKEQNIPPK